MKHLSRSRGNITEFEISQGFVYLFSLCPYDSIVEKGIPEGEIAVNGCIAETACLFDV